MRRIAAIAILLLPVMGEAEEAWVPLDGAGVQTALEDRKLQYKSASQTFYASGKTLYNQGGRDSWGYWRVQGDQYCSQWPPSDLWACFDLLVRDGEVRFVGLNSDITDGAYVD